MLQRHNQSWLTIEIGGRLLRCETYNFQQGKWDRLGSVTVDVESEGLITAEEIAAMIARIAGSVAHLPAVVILPDSLIKSELVERTPTLKEEVAQAFGGMRGDSDDVLLVMEDLDEVPGFSQPVWVGIAEQKSIIRQLAPLLGTGLRVEFVTSTANALAATYKSAARKRILHFEEGMTTLLQMENAMPVYVGTLDGGGGRFVETLADGLGSSLDEAEAMLTSKSENEEEEAAIARVLSDGLQSWVERIKTSFEENEVLGPLYLTGEYGEMPRVRSALTALGLELEESQEDREESPIGGGAVKLAAGQAEPALNMLPTGLLRQIQSRERERRFRGLTVVLFIVVGIALGVATHARYSELATIQTQLEGAEQLLSEQLRASAIIEEIEFTERKIRPLLRGQLLSTESYEVAQTIIEAGEQFGFQIERLVDARFFMDERNRLTEARGNSSRRIERRISPAEASEWWGYILEVSLEGEPEERLDQLREVVTALEESPLVLHVDRLPTPRLWQGRVDESNGAPAPNPDRASYFLRLTTDGEPPAFQPSGSRSRRQG